LSFVKAGYAVMSQNYLAAQGLTGHVAADPKRCVKALGRIPHSRPGEATK